jgi:hypothetical protein
MAVVINPYIPRFQMADWCMMVKWLIVLLLVSSTALALTVNPQEYRITQISPGKTYPVVATIINSESASYTIRLQLDQRSIYMKDIVSFETSELNIGPNEKKNIRLSVRADESSLSPEEHVATILVMSDSLKLGEFRVKISVEGERMDDLRLDRVSLSDISSSKPIYAIITLRNDGNVIARANPIMEIYEGQKFIERFGEESEIMVMPGTVYNITLMYDPSLLAPGDYLLKSTMVYANSLETNTIEVPFSIHEDDGQERVYASEGESLKYMLSGLDNGVSYSVRYIISGTSVEGTIEGIAGEEGLVIELPSQDLQVGTYDVSLIIGEGQQRHFTLEVKQGGMLLWPFLLIAVMLVVAVVFRKPLLEPIRIRRLAHQVRLSGSRLAADEEHLRKLSHELSYFISESNQWLDSRYGRGRYGFR